MSKELSSINLRIAENGYTISADYRETEPKKNEGICCGPNKDYVCETEERALSVIRGLLAGKDITKEKSAKEEIKGIYSKANAAKEEA